MPISTAMSRADGQRLGKEMTTKATSARKLRAAELTADDIAPGIDRIRKRISELQLLFRVNDLDKLDREASSVKKKIDETLSQVFGAETTEYFRYRVDGLYARTKYMEYGEDPLDYVAEHRKYILDGITTLNTAISMLEERLDVLDKSPTGRAKRAIDGLELHAEIERAAGQLYRNGHYANAVEDAVKALNALVRLRSGVEQDGVSLMQHVGKYILDKAE